MQQVPLDLKINPTNVEEIDTWRSELLWKPMTKDDIVEYIRTKIKSHPEVKSGVVLYRDFALNAFQNIAFSSRAIIQPEEANAVVKIKRPEPAKRPYTFEEKTEALKVFITQNGRFPNETDKFTEGPNLFTFYKSLKRSQDKYTGIIDDCKSNPKYDASREAAASGDDHGRDGGRRGGRVLGGRGSDELEEEIDLADEEEVAPEPKKQTKGKKAK